nr:hypothetical protein CFP56_53604 [Quercus suber]
MPLGKRLARKERRTNFIVLVTNTSLSPCNDIFRPRITIPILKSLLGWILTISGIRERTDRDSRVFFGATSASA